ncbi:hypothetical protein N0V93_004644 [Gnomoniopsis smithogilvyi]|uniref:Uncharacterized protein n=1 Tax=Gnomoniopsis smithogilvyi TaxID=1191159 RepID=A0A9W8YRE9_9PEZI|nr:hypothetical protein N0V93_004644 [Gnomoniopsis smithogilvyi]
MISPRPGSEPSSARRRRCWNLVMDHCKWDYPSDTAQHYGHVLVAIVLFLVAQLLTCAWDQPFWKYGIDFPGQIVAMVFVWLFMWAIQLAFFHPGEGLERIYYLYLKAPTEVLNKHMSIGFTVPFLSLISQSFAGGNQVGLLTLAFVMTGVLNAIIVYTVAYYVQLRLTKFRPRTRRHRENVLDGAPRAHARSSPTRRPAPTFLCPRDRTCSSAERGGGTHDRDSFSRLDRFRKHISDVSTLCTLSGYASDCNGPINAYREGQGTEMSPGRPEDALRTLESGSGISTPEPIYLGRTRITKGVLIWTKQNIFLTLAILIFLFPGLLLSSLQATDFPLDVGFLFTVWLTFASAQTRLKQRLLQHQSRPQHMKVLTAITTLLNPVLWTSLALLCFGLAKAHIRAPTFGAGDLATSILNAGIVSWGLKLFEYRAALLSRGGLTVLLTSAIAAALNVVAWPLLASRALGVQPPASALSFAARSVTIALGGPAVARLGGDAGVNAVGVVVNGIVFQLVAGCFVGGESFCGRIARWRAKCGAHVQRASLRWRWPGTSTAFDEEKAHTTEALRQPAGCRHVRYSSDVTHLDDGRRTPTSSGPFSEPVAIEDDDVRMVAGGATIGINAAAMGTSHLYEQASGAAAYSALAMTVFGVFTVLFTVPSPMVVWLRGMVGA